MSKKVPFYILGILALFAVFFFWIVPRSPFLFGFVETMYGPIIPARCYADNLASTDNDLVRESLGMLEKRANPIAVDRAIPLLQSSDDYVWLNAALYLGKCSRPEAVPYLIKALRHTASRSYSDDAECLHNITGQDFGTDFTKWQHWWLAAHPDSKIDWESHLGPIPHLPRNGT